MRKISKYLIVSVILLGRISFCQCQQGQAIDDQNKNNILILNPGVGSIRSFINLIDNKIIDIPNIQITGVLYSNANNDYERLSEFLEQNDYPFVFIEKIEGDLQPDNLFRENFCSEDFRRIFKNSDGIMFLGGDDIYPSIYGDKTNLLTSTRDQHRHYFELSFAFHLLGGSQNEDFIPYLEDNPDYVIYGFCLGAQMINVATGGTLYQDIPTEIYSVNNVEDILEMDADSRHKNYWYRLPGIIDIMPSHFHRISLLKEQFFVEVMKLNPDYQPFVLSTHHQALKELGKGFQVIARSIDGKIIEGISHKNYKNVIAVQFHPEP